MLLDIILASNLATFALFVLFKTNFIYEYSKLLKLNKIKIFKEYEDFIKVSYLNFIEFLGMKNRFIFNLLSCPFCVNFWIILMIIFIFKFSLLYLGLLYIISITEYMLLNLLHKYEKD
jgi:hypothetical protein